MTVRDLNRDQLVALKQRYLVMLDESGELNEILYGDADDGNSLTYMELANADALVPDDAVFRNWEGVWFEEDDFATADNERRMA